MTDPNSPAAGAHLEPPSELEQALDHPHFLVQAPVPPLDVDGFAVVVLGVVGFAAATIGFLVYADRLEAAGHSWWLGVTISGFVLGLIGLAYAINRRRRRRAGLWNRD